MSINCHYRQKPIFSGNSSKKLLETNQRCLAKTEIANRMAFACVLPLGTGSGYRLLASCAVTLSRPILALLAAIFLASWLIPSITRTLVRPDEGRYTEIAREMAESGDFVTPRLNGLKYFEKPPLQYWTTALAISVFGQNEFTARWWPLFSGFLGLGLVWLTVRALAGRDVAWVTVGLLGAMIYYFIIAHINTVDMSLAAFMTLTMVGLIRGFGVDGQSANATRSWMIAAWAGAAFAFLSKGLIGIVLPGAIFVLYVLVSRQWRLLTRMEWIWGPLAFVLIALPWPLLVQGANPEWAHFFFIYEHFERFSNTEHGRDGALYYFVPILLVGLLPWTPAVLAFLRRDGRAAIRETYAKAQMNVPLFLAIWCAFLFVFFSISRSKLPSYLLPSVPAFAMLLAPVMLRMPNVQFGRLFIAVALVPLGLLVAAAINDRFESDAYTPGMVNAYAKYFVVSAALYAAAIAAAWWLNGKSRRVDALIVASALATAAGSCLAIGYGTLSASTSSKQLVVDFIAVEPGYRGDDIFFSIGMYEQTLPAYLKRTVTLVDYLDEMGLGAYFEPDKVRFNFADFAEEWEALDRGYAVTDFDQLPRLDFAGLDYRVVATDLRRAIIARHPK